MADIHKKPKLKKKNIFTKNIQMKRKLIVPRKKRYTFNPLYTNLSTTQQERMVCIS